MSKFLPQYRENTLYYLKKSISSYSQTTISWEEIQDICRLYRMLGTTCLFLEDDEEVLFECLNKSAYAFLNTIVNIKMTDRAFSKELAFFDALACKNYDVARQIANIAPKKHNPDLEYEDDYLYISFISKLLESNSSSSDREKILARYEELLAGNEDVQFDICKSLQLKDSELFVDSLKKMITKRETYYRKMSDSELLSPEQLETEGKLFIEGLALLNLANSIEMNIDDEFMYLPATLVKHKPVQVGVNDWMSV